MKIADKIRVKRAPERGKYDRQTIYDILDNHFLCHISFLFEDYPVIIPTLYGRYEDRLYIHGATTSRMLRTLGSGVNMSLSVTLVDGMVLARSAFHHSMNYRSVVLFGKAKLVDQKDKFRSLKIISDHLYPGRWDEVRKPNEKELNATSIISIPIQEASAKIRKGPPIDDPPDYELNIWAGVIPLKLTALHPIPDPKLKVDLSPSKVIENTLIKYITNT